MARRLHTVAHCLSILPVLAVAVPAVAQSPLRELLTGEKAPEQPAATRPAAGADTLDLPVRPPCDEVAARYTGRDVRSWPERRVHGKTCRVSPALSAGPRDELGHHRLVVTYTGDGTVEASIAHGPKDALASVLGNRSLCRPPRKVASGRELTVASRYKGERFGWVVLRTVGDVTISRVRHTAWRGKGTLYGHVGRTFEFAGAELPFRLMYPKDYDPRRAYPLVISVAGSGSVGSGNVRSMEMVILARFLFTHYYDDPDFACFSLVTQIPPFKAIPAPYWPKGERGKPEPVYHPDWATVNENGWYVQATLALIERLKAHEAIRVDPDRVYYTGFSYGGKACWEFLKAGREVFAAAVCGAGWPVGRAFSTPGGDTLARLRQEVRRYKHVPVLIFVGAKDRMRFGSRAVHKEILAAGGRSTYVEFPDTEHVFSAGKGWGQREHVAWLFKQDREKNPPAGKDPFPGGVYDGPE